MIENFSDFVNESVDDIKYGKKRDHNQPEIAIDNLPMIDPPPNSSDQTKQEIEEIKSMPNANEFDISNDKKFSDTFAKYVSDNNVPITEDQIISYTKRVKDIVIALKNHYDRPRPVQLASYHGINLKPYPSKSSSTASYPSGHSVQPFAIATAISKKYPKLKDGLFKLADEIAKGRMRMKIHYRSDYEYGKLLGKQIGDTLSIN